LTRHSFDDGFNDRFNQALNEFNPKLEEEKQCAEEAGKRVEDIIQKAMQALMDQGKSEAKKMLGV
jgi:hypothetical protein